MSQRITATVTRAIVKVGRIGIGKKGVGTGTGTKNKGFLITLTLPRGR